MNGERHKGQIEEIAEALAERLTEGYPGGPAINDIQDDDLQNWLGRVLNLSYAEGDPITMEGVLASIEYNEILQAISMAVSLWKSQVTIDDEASTKGNGKKEPSSSFSLLDQLQGGLLANFVAIEDIVEASSEEERLKLLKKVAHVDDITHDWDQILPILNESLQKCDEGSFLFWEYLQLIRTWFDQGRSSVEYTRLQHDICRNVMLAIQTRMSILFARKLKDCNEVSTNIGAWYNDKALVQMVQIWHGMWTDLMQRGVYMEQSAETIEVTMLLWLRGLSVSGNVSPNTSVQPFPTHAILALVDTQAAWLFSWTRLVSPERLVMLIEYTGILPSILKRCAVAPALKRIGESYETGRHHNSSILDQALYLHSVAVLHAILVRTRVSHFPWHVLSTESPLSQLDSQPMSTVDVVSKATSICVALQERDDEIAEMKVSLTSPTEGVLKEILDIFITVLAKMTNVDESWVKLCGDAIETILCGCSSKTKPFAVEKIKSRMQVVANADDDCYIATLLKSLDAIQWGPL